MFTIKFNDSGMTMTLSNDDVNELFPDSNEWAAIVAGTHPDVKLTD